MEARDKTQAGPLSCSQQGRGRALGEHRDGFCCWRKKGDGKLGVMSSVEDRNRESSILEAAQQIKRRSRCLAFSLSTANCWPAAVEGSSSVCLQCHLELQNNSSVARKYLGLTDTDSAATPGKDMMREGKTGLEMPETCCVCRAGAGPRAASHHRAGTRRVRAEHGW